MRAAVKALLTWIGSAAFWVAEKLWGDQAFAWLHPMIPSEFASLENALRLFWAYGLPLVLFLIGLYWFYRAGKVQTQSGPAAGKSIALSDDQKRRLFVEIREFKELSKGILIIVRPGDDADAQALAFQFRNFFDKAEIDTSLDYIRPEPDQAGIMIAVQDVVDPPPEAVSLHRALVNADVDAKIVAMPRDTYKSPFVLMIGRMPG